MNPLVLYLITINGVTFLAFVIDFLLCIWKPELDETVANSLILDMFAIAGGAVGMLLALFVLTGLGRGHRMNKNNVAWWFLAVVSFVVWGLVVAAQLGLVHLDMSGDGMLHGWDLDKLRVLGMYLAAINAVTFVVFTWDKHVAQSGNDCRKRIPEARLLGLGLVGGSGGGLLAMHIVRHKTKKWYFAWGLPCFIVLHVALVLYAHMCGLM